MFVTLSLIYSRDFFKAYLQSASVPRTAGVDQSIHYNVASREKDNENDIIKMLALKPTGNNKNYVKNFK